jgi:hypothetical protein
MASFGWKWNQLQLILSAQSTQWLAVVWSCVCGRTYFVCFFVEATVYVQIVLHKESRNTRCMYVSSLLKIQCIIEETLGGIHRAFSADWFSTISLLCHYICLCANLSLICQTSPKTRLPSELDLGICLGFKASRESVKRNTSISKGHDPILSHRHLIFI